MTGQQCMYKCAFRTGSTTSDGTRAAPNGCRAGGFDSSQKFSLQPGNCSGEFCGRPVCSSFIPTEETRAGRLLLAIRIARSAELDRKLEAMVVRSGPQAGDISGDAVAAAMAKVHTHTASLLKGLTLIPLSEVMARHGLREKKETAPLLEPAMG